MRHGVAHRKLNRTVSHRKAMLANMAASLIEMPAASQWRRISTSTMFATLRCSCSAAWRTARLIAGLMRRFSVEIFVRGMRHNIT